MRRYGTWRDHPEAGGLSRPIRQQKMLICRMFSTEATGLEPATSGVTGRAWRFRAERPYAGMSGMSRGFPTRRCGDCRTRRGLAGSSEGCAVATKGNTAGWERDVGGRAARNGLLLSAGPSASGAGERRGSDPCWAKVTVRPPTRRWPRPDTGTSQVIRARTATGCGAPSDRIAAGLRPERSSCHASPGAVRPAVSALTAMFGSAHLEARRRAATYVVTEAPRPTITSPRPRRTASLRPPAPRGRSAATRSRAGPCRGCTAAILRRSPVARRPPC